MSKKLPANFLTDGIKVCGDKVENQAIMVVVGFKDGNQLTFVNSEANNFLLHYLNGLMMQEHTKIPTPISAEWNEVVKKIQ